MLLRERKEGEVVRCAYDSEDIPQSAYNRKEERLVLTFKSGKSYEFCPVNLYNYTAFKLAKSQRAYFHKYIKSDRRIKVKAIDGK